MRYFFRQFFTAVLILAAASCGRMRVPIDKSVFNISDADLAEQSPVASVEQPTESIVLKKPIERYRVGVLIPLSGPSAKLGENLQKSAMMALFDMNNPKLILQFYDTEGTQEGARNAAETAVSQGVELIIGPVFSKEVHSVRPIARDADIGVITFSSDPSNFGKGVYTISTLTSQQAEMITRYACEKGYKRFAILSQDNMTGDIISYAVKKAADECGAKITKAGFYDPKIDNLQPSVASIMPRMMEDLEKERDEEIKRLESSIELVYAGKPVPMKDEETGEWKDVHMTEKQLDETIEALKTKELIRDPFEFDAIFVSDDGSRLRSLGALFSYYDLPKEIRVLGTSQWAEAKPARESSLIGGWFANLPTAGFQGFAARFKEIYGEKPLRIASQAYDAVALASVLTDMGGFSYSNLTTPSGFNGVDGLFRLLPNGESERGLEVLGVERRGFVTLAPTIEKFENDPVQAPEVFIGGFRFSPALIYVPEAETVIVDETTDKEIVLTEPAEQKTDEKAVQEPVIEKPVQKPVIKKPTQKPVVEKAVQKPVIEKATQKPVVEKAVQKPVIEKATQKPAMKKAVQKPVIEKPTQKPVYRKAVQKPVISN